MSEARSNANKNKVDTGQPSNHELLSAIVASSVDAIISLDREGKITAWNPAAEQLFGFTAQETISKPVAELLAPAHLCSQVVEILQKVARGEGPFQQRQKKDGRLLDLSITTFGVRNQAGELIGVSGICHDISDLKQAEQAQAFLASIVESSTVAIISIARDGKVSSWNRAAESLYGYSAQEMLGQPLQVLMPEGERCDEFVAQAMRGEHRGLHDVRRRLKDGRMINLSVSQSPILDKTGAVIGLASLERSASEETRLERELQQAHAHMRSLIESSLDAMFTVGTDLVIADVNEQALKLIGATREAIIGSRFDRYFTDLERAGQCIRRALSEGYVTNYDLALNSGGREITVSVNAAVFRDPAGQPRGVFAVARDVTEQKEIEQQLRQAQAYTRGMIESSVDGMLTVDSNLVITDVNERMAALAETPKTMLIGSRLDRLFTDPERAAAGIRQALTEGSVTNYDLNLRALSGREIPVSFNASIFHDAAGRPQGVFGVARDVTEQRQLDQQLREQQIYSRSLIESSIDPILTVDPQFNITDVNEQTVSLTGYSRAELIGSSFPMLFTDPERAMQGVHQTLAEGCVRDYELTLRSAAGEERLLCFNASPFKDAQGEVLGILASARDVSVGPRNQEGSAPHRDHRGERDSVGKGAPELHKGGHIWIRSQTVQ